MDLSRSTVAVTGATGFIGRYLVRELLARGAQVIGVVRNPDKVPQLRRHDGIELRQADLGDQASLTRAFVGCDAVISNAAVVSIGRKSFAELIRSNVEGTQNVLRAMQHADVNRVVMTSSASSYRRKAHGTPYVESDPLWTEADRNLPFFFYAISKAVAEREAWQLARNADIKLTTARPGGVYGAYDKSGITSWLQRIMRVPLVTVFPSRMAISTVYAADLAAGMVTMLDRDHSIDKAYNLTGDASGSLWQLYQGYRDAGGTTPRLVLPLPLPIRYRYDIRAAQRDLDFVNRSPFEAFDEILTLQRDDH